MQRWPEVTITLYRDENSGEEICKSNNVSIMYRLTRVIASFLESGR